MKKKSKTISLTGNDRGFSVMEVLLSVVILSVAITAVYQPLLASTMALQYAEERFEAGRLLNNELWNIREGALRTKRVPGLGSDVLVGDHRAYDYNFASFSVGDGKNLHRIDATLSWRRSGKQKKIKRSIYAGIY